MKRALQLDVDLIIANDFQGMKIPNIIITWYWLLSYTWRAIGKSSQSVWKH
jgi:hypothetical protein